MPYKNLQSFIERLRHEKDIVTIDCPVDPYLELAEIHRRVISENGPALLFTNIKGKAFPVVSNLFGTKKRVDIAFGKRPEDFLRAAVHASQHFAPSLKTLWQHRSLIKGAFRLGTKNGSPTDYRRLPNADLSQLPAITSWVEDGGPFLTLPLVHTRGAKSENLGIYRMQIFSPNETGMHFQIGKGGGYHLHEAEQENRDLPVNVYLGGPPALLLSAIAPLPENVPELLLASLIMGDKLKCQKEDTHRPSQVLDFEFCLKGFVPAHVRKPEGPFGDHYGYYSLQHDYPVFRVEEILHRNKPIFPATVVGKPRQEDFYLGDYLQDMLSPLFPLVMPQVHALWSYGETGYHALTSAVIKERFSREALTAAFRILGEGQLSLTKFLMLVDHKMDLKDFRSVLTHILERVQWERDLYIVSELSMDSLDYAGPKINHGSKGVLLGLGEAIRSLPHEFTNRGIPSYVRKAQAFCPGCLVVEIPSYADSASLVQTLTQEEALTDWQLIIAVDDLEKTVASEAMFLWTVFTRFEPAADIHAREVKLHRYHPVLSGPIVIDARMKPWYPQELFCDEATHKLVDARWKEYFHSK